MSLLSSTNTVPPLSSSFLIVSFMNTLSLSVSNPRGKNGIRWRISLNTWASSLCSCTSNGAHSVQPVAMSVSVNVCTKLPFDVCPLRATRSASTNPGGGLSQPSKVRTATLRRIAAAGGARRRLLLDSGSLAWRSARSIAFQSTISAARTAAVRAVDPTLTGLPRSQQTHRVLAAQATHCDEFVQDTSSFLPVARGITCYQCSDQHIPCCHTDPLAVTMNIGPLVLTNIGPPSGV
jgi:hypothetical protein